MMTEEERIRDLHFCDARLGEPCNIKEICKELLAKLAHQGSAEETDYDESIPHRLAVAGFRHTRTNYEDVVGELPGCWDMDEDLQPCADHLFAYLAIKHAANDLLHTAREE